MIIDGKKISMEVIEEIKKEISFLKKKTNKIPGLSVILIGDFTPSQIYVKNKQKKSLEVGINSEIIRYPEKISDKRFLKRLKN